MQARHIHALLLMCLLFLPGCNLHDNSSENPIVAEIQEPTGKARLSLAFEIPDRKPLPAIRTSGSGNATVTAVINIVAGGKVSTLKRQAPVVNGAVTINFTSLPEGSALGEFGISGGHLAGYSDFHGAVDLGAGENTLTASPIGCGLDSDILATIFQQVVLTQAIVTTRVINLVSIVSSLIVETKLSSANPVQNSTIFEKLVNVVKPVGMVSVKPSNDLGSISGYDSTGSLIWIRTAIEVFAGIPGLAEQAASFKVFRVISQGLSGSAYLAWKHSIDNLYVITRVNTKDGATLATLTNPGDLTAEIWQAENLLIAGGFHSIRKCPVVIKWACNNNASTGLQAGITQQGLEWCNFFSEYASDGNSSGVTRLNFSFSTGLKAIIEDIVTKQLRYIDISLNDGSYKLPDQSANFSVSSIPGNARVTLSWLANPNSTYDLYWGTSASITADSGNCFPNVKSPFLHSSLTNTAEYHYFLIEKKTGGGTAESYRVKAIPLVSLNQKPMVAILDPKPLQSFIMGNDVVVNMQATDNDGSVASVSLYVDGIFYARVNQAPYSVLITNLTSGPHNIYIAASDDSGAITRSGTVEFNVISEITGINLTGRIIGHLKSEHTGLPVSGAMIGIAGTGIYTITDATGYFALENLAPGTYDLVIKRDGYTSRTIKGIIVN